jgi:hypothetical protein
MSDKSAADCSADDDDPVTSLVVFEAWLEEKGYDHGVDTDGDIVFQFMLQGRTYTGTVVEKDDCTLTLFLSIDVAPVVDELTLRCAFDGVHRITDSGAFILRSDLRVISWRESQSSSDGEALDGEDIDCLIHEGVWSIGQLVIALAVELGISASDATLEFQEAAGEA